MNKPIIGTSRQGKSVLMGYFKEFIELTEQRKIFTKLTDGNERTETIGHARANKQVRGKESHGYR